VSPDSRVTAIVPTLGRSPWLIPCLEALRREGVEIIVIDQSETPLDLPDRVIRPGKNLGFAAATNLGIAESSREYVATVNDDALVEPGWAASLVEALDHHPKAAAAQGINFSMGGLVDGCGIEWNQWGQAIQVGHGKPAPFFSEPREVWGVSATAAIYRREALGNKPFDPRLVSYYEDVDLAGRLRADGWSALLVPAAQARHAGSATGGTMSRERWRLVYGNRWLVARGQPFWRMAVRDLLDLARAFGSGDLSRAAGIPSGWLRALRLRRQ
jgi:N-acetylglucosaminyl-diphospho-decaprenol L-rhamnosyltransferase